MHTVETDLMRYQAEHAKQNEQVIEWERRFDIVVSELLDGYYLSFNTKPSKPALDIIEKCAADLVDIYLEMER